LFRLPAVRRYTIHDVVFGSIHITTATICPLDYTLPPPPPPPPPPSLIHPTRLAINF
jgi:hypothetical protein